MPAGDLAALAAAAAISRLTLKVVRQNLAWAAIYNLVALPLAAAGLFTPLSAAAGMSLSSIVVVVNALRLVRTGAKPGPVGTADRSSAIASRASWPERTRVAAA